MVLYFPFIDVLYHYINQINNTNKITKYIYFSECFENFEEVKNYWKNRFILIKENIDDIYECLKNNDKKNIINAYDNYNYDYDKFFSTIFYYCIYLLNNYKFSNNKKFENIILHLNENNLLIYNNLLLQIQNIRSKINNNIRVIYQQIIYKIKFFNSFDEIKQVLYDILEKLYKYLIFLINTHYQLKILLSSSINNDEKNKLLNNFNNLIHNEEKELFKNINNKKSKKDKEEKIQKEKKELLKKTKEEKIQKEKEKLLKKAEEERLRKAEEEKIQKEKIQKEKEELLRKAEEERLRKAEEERLRKAEEEKIQKEKEELLKEVREEEIQKLEEERLKEEEIKLKNIENENNKLKMYIQNEINDDDIKLIEQFFNINIKKRQLIRNDNETNKRPKYHNRVIDDDDENIIQLNNELDLNDLRKKQEFINLFFKTVNKQIFINEKQDDINLKINNNYYNDKKFYFNNDNINFIDNIIICIVPMNNYISVLNKYIQNHKLKYLLICNFSNDIFMRIKNFNNKKIVKINKINNIKDYNNYICLFSFTLKNNKKNHIRLNNNKLDDILTYLYQSFIRNNNLVYLNYK